MIAEPVRCPVQLFLRDQDDRALDTKRLAELVFLISCLSDLVLEFLDKRCFIFSIGRSSNSRKFYEWKRI